MIDEILQEDNVSKAVDVSFKVNESMLEVCVNDAIVPNDQALKLELVESYEDFALGLRMESDILSRNSLAKCVVDLKESVSCIDKLISSGILCTIGASSH